MNNIGVVGSSGAIGHAMVQRFLNAFPAANIHTFSRQKPGVDNNTHHHCIDYANEASIQEAVFDATKQGAFDCVVVTTGVLHDSETKPEKSLSAITAQNLHKAFQANTIFPVLVAKHFLPHLNRQERAVFAALSARVGSISDNQLGGWYAYRASKAALNMLIKTAAIEVGRYNKHAVVVGLHPGTVDSKLSKPFQRNVPEAKLFTPDYSASKLFDVLQSLTSKQSGKCFCVGRPVN